MNVLITPEIDWSTHREPVYLKSGTLVPGKFAVVRDDTHQAISVVGSRYKIQDHRKNLQYVNNLVSSLTDDITISHSVDDARIYTRFLLNSVGIMGGIKNEAANLAIDVYNTYDGTRCLEISLSVWRKICSNGAFGFARDFTFHKAHTLSLHVNKSTIKGLSDAIEATGKRYQDFYTRLANEKPIPGDKISDKFGDRFIKKVNSEFVSDRDRSAWGQYNSFTSIITHSKTNQTTKLQQHKLLFTMFTNYFNLPAGK